MWRLFSGFMTGILTGSEFRVCDGGHKKRASAGHRYWKRGVTSVKRQKQIPACGRQASSFRWRAFAHRNSLGMTTFSAVGENQQEKRMFAKTTAQSAFDFAQDKRHPKKVCSGGPATMPAALRGYRKVACCAEAQRYILTG